MPRPIPTLGYPSRSAAVRALREDGWSTRQIAALLGIAQDVTALEHSAGRGRKRRLFPGRTVLFSQEFIGRAALEQTDRCAPCVWLLSRDRNT
jgi:hypothetical protein